MSDRERRSIDLRRIAVVTVSGSGIFAGGPARTLECPLPHPTGTPTAIEQTAEDVRTYAELLAVQGTGAVPEIVSQLRQAHPGATAAEIVNVLVTDYCPIVNGNACLEEGHRGHTTRHSPRVSCRSWPRVTGGSRGPGETAAEEVIAYVEGSWREHATRRRRRP